MSETLHKILARHISWKLSDVTEEERLETVEALEAKIEKEIVEEKSNELTLAQTKKLEQKEKELQRKKKKVELDHLENLKKQIREAFWMAGVIGTLIGLFVNQITDLISAGKGVSPEMPIGWTTFWAFIFGGVCCAIFFVFYVSICNKITENHMQKDEL